MYFIWLAVTLSREAIAKLGCCFFVGFVCPECAMQQPGYFSYYFYNFYVRVRKLMLLNVAPMMCPNQGFPIVSHYLRSEHIFLRFLS